MAPAGGQQKAGGHAQLGVDLPHDFHAPLPSGGAHADHIIAVQGGGVDRSGIHGQFRRRCSGSGGNEGDLKVAVIVEGEDIVLLLLQLHLRPFAVGKLHGYGVQQNAGDGDGGLQVHHGYLGGVVFLLVLGRVQDVDENDRGHADQLEAGIHGGAEGVAVMSETVLFLAVAELADGLRPAVGNDGLVGHVIGVVCQVDGGGPEYHLKSGGAQDGGDQTGGLLQNSDAMFKRHLAHSFLDIGAVLQRLFV